MFMHNRVFDAGANADGATLCSLYFQAQLVRLFSASILSTAMIELCNLALACDSMKEIHRRRDTLEHCASCGMSLLFSCNTADDATAGHSSSQCSGCGLATERCCFSLCLITTSPEDLSLQSRASSIDSRQQNRTTYRSNSSSKSSDIVLSCPVCGAVTSVALLRSYHRGIALCPFCAVWMLPI